jgi:two-component system, chemotaxis family, chemotaxis protein CheY
MRTFLTGANGFIVHPFHLSQRPQDRGYVGPMNVEEPLVLIVEDDLDMQMGLRDALTGAGYRVTIAGNGEQALGSLKEELPAVILLDLLMPVMNGWQFRRAQLADARLAAIPVVVLTAGTPGTDAAASISADAWLAKPVDAAHLVAVLARVGADGFMKTQFSALADLARVAGSPVLAMQLGLYAKLVTLAGNRAKMEVTREILRRDLRGYEEHGAAPALIAVLREALALLDTQT